MNEIKINVIPDIHCKSIWKTLVEHTSDICIFLGDYVDSFTHSNTTMIKNLIDIVQFKKDTWDKTILLLGNHDLSYVYREDNKFMCSGYRSEIAFDIQEIFKGDINLFQNAFQYKNYIFTHAGIQNHWFNNYFKGNLNENIAEQLNNPTNREQEEALYMVGYRRWGNWPVGGIFWCDKEELKKPLKGYNQVVGHTHVKKLIKISRKEDTVYFCDYLDKLEQPLILNI